MRLVDERDVSWEVIARHFRTYVYVPGQAAISAYDFEAEGVEEAIVLARAQLRPTERMALAAIVDAGDGRGCVWLVGQDPSAVGFGEM